VTENIDRTPVGTFMHAIVAANAEFYSANLALFERLVVYDDKIGEAEIAEPFATLADPDLPKALMERLSPPAPFLLALVRVRPFQWS
jgi:hypothetical protein